MFHLLTDFDVSSSLSVVALNLLCFELCSDPAGHTSNVFFFKRMINFSHRATMSCIMKKAKCVPKGADSAPINPSLTHTWMCSAFDPEMSVSQVFSFHYLLTSLLNPGISLYYIPHLFLLWRNSPVSVRRVTAVFRRGARSGGETKAHALSDKLNWF